VFAPGGRQEPSEAEPVFLRKPALGDGDVTAEPCLRRQEIIEAGVKAMARDVVPDREEMA